ncbi:MAG: hypothetical protein KJO69_08315 [Gammaproteobacteria bacterium]|nr:hypothetical protein [Gammaproteobacteria bacterium]
MNPTGTAAFTGIGGVGGTFGGDYSTMHVNPAGLADFKESKFVFSPMVSTYGSDAFLDGTFGAESSDSKTAFGFGNLGFVSVRKGRPGSSTKNFNIGIGFSRVADFNNAIFYQGSTAGSILDFWSGNANSSGIDNLDPFSTELAFEAAALFELDGESGLFTDLELDGVPVDQPISKSQIINRSGSMNEINIAFAGNVSNKLNYGINIGMPLVSYSEEKIYREEGPGVEITAFDELNFDENLSISGLGINLKAGLQYSITRKFRVGAAIHTPTLLSLTDDFNNGLTYSYNLLDPATGSLSLQTASATSPDGNFEYRFQTPWRFIGSTGTIFSLGSVNGFISGDIELVDYSAGEFNLTSDSDNIGDLAYENELNREITNVLSNAINFRIGTELAFESLRFRGGIGMNQSPYASDDGQYNYAYALGMGFRFEGFFLDIGYRRTTTDSGYYPYFDGTTSSPLVEVSSVTNNIVATAGFSF